MLKHTLLISAASTVLFVAYATPVMADMEFVPQQDTKTMIEEGMPDDGAMNYFASGKHNKEVKGQAGSMPTSPEAVQKHNELVEKQKRLPSAAKIEGKAKLKVQNGQLVTNSVDDPAYVDCSAFASETPENTPDECKQAKEGSDAPMEEIGNNAAVPADTSKTEHVLKVPADMDKVGNEAAPKATGDIVKKTSIMDRKNNVQTNIISNTDTGVDIGE